MKRFFILLSILFILCCGTEIDEKETKQFKLYYKIIWMDTNGEVVDQFFTTNYFVNNNGIVFDKITLHGEMIKIVMCIK